MAPYTLDSLGQLRVSKPQPSKKRVFKHVVAQVPTARDQHEGNRRAERIAERPNGRIDCFPREKQRKNPFERQDQRVRDDHEHDTRDEQVLGTAVEQIKSVHNSDAYSYELLAIGIGL